MVKVGIKDGLLLSLPVVSDFMYHLGFDRWRNNRHLEYSICLASWYVPFQGGT